MYISMFICSVSSSKHALASYFSISFLLPPTITMVAAFEFVTLSMNVLVLEVQYWKQFKLLSQLQEMSVCSWSCHLKKFEVSPPPPPPRPSIVM